MDVKTVVVTGASSGIGWAVVERLAGNGMTVCALARRAGKLKELEDAFPGKVYGYAMDVSDLEQVRATFARIREDHGGVDALINNAGIVPTTVLGRDDVASIHATIDINLKGTMFCTDEVVPGMVERGAGRIINVASRGGVVGGAGPASPDDPISLYDYGASKFGVVGFANGIGRVLLPRGVIVTTLCPGGINTPVAANWNVDKDKLMQPDQIAELIEFLLAQRDNIVYKQMLFFAPHEWH